MKVRNSCGLEVSEYAPNYYWQVDRCPAPRVQYSTFQVYCSRRGMGIEKRASSFGSAVVWSVTQVCLWKEVEVV